MQFWCFIFWDQLTSFTIRVNAPAPLSTEPQSSLTQLRLSPPIIKESKSIFRKKVLAIFPSLYSRLGRGDKMWTFLPPRHFKNTSKFAYIFYATNDESACNVLIVADKLKTLGQDPSISTLVIYPGWIEKSDLIDLNDFNLLIFRWAIYEEVHRPKYYRHPDTSVGKKWRSDLAIFHNEAQGAFFRCLSTILISRCSIIMASIVLCILILTRCRLRIWITFFCFRQASCMRRAHFGLDNPSSHRR